MLNALKRNPRDRAIAALAIPALGTLAIDPLVSIVDTMWVGRLGTTELAALAVASAVFAAVFAVFNFIHVTITPMVAGEVGRGSPERAGGITKGALLISVAIGAILALVLGVLAESIVEAFGATGGVLEQSAAYLKIRVLSMPAMLLAMVAVGVYRGHQDTRTPLYVALVMNLVNLLLDPILIFGAGLGVVGAAWATVAAQTLAAAGFLILLFGRDRAKFGLDGRINGVRGLGLGRILGEGWPMMLRSIALLFALTATTYAATQLGTPEVAAHQIALQTWLFMSFVLDSLAVAAMAMIGSDMGADDRIAAREVGNRLLALGFMGGTILALGLALIRPFLAPFFSAEPHRRGASWVGCVVRNRAATPHCPRIRVGWHRYRHQRVPIHGCLNGRELGPDGRSTRRDRRLTCWSVGLLDRTCSQSPCRVCPVVAPGAALLRTRSIPRVSGNRVTR